MISFFQFWFKLELMPRGLGNGLTTTFHHITAVLQISLEESGTAGIDISCSGFSTFHQYFIYFREKNEDKYNNIDATTMSHRGTCKAYR